MALVMAPLRAIGLELEPRFNEPYLSTSLQDFWGRRWNQASSNILRMAIYRPVRTFTARTFGPRWAQQVGIVAAFTVSGFMHEVVYYHTTRFKPTWELSWFFLIHGVCTAAEVTAKKAEAWRWQLPTAVAIPATVAFVIVTGSWLGLAELLRNPVDEKVIGECSILVEFIWEKMLPPPFFNLTKN